MTATGCESERCRAPGRAAVDGLRLCAGCLRVLRGQLADLPEHHARCADVLSARRGRGSEGVLDVLSRWSALVVRERMLPGPERRDVGDHAAFLCQSLDWLAAHPAAAAFAAEITGVADAVQRVLNPNPVVRTVLGPCPRPGCDRMVVAAGRAQDRFPPPQVACDAGHSWRPGHWRSHERRHERGRAVPAELAATP